MQLFNEDTYRILIETAPEAIWVTDADGNFIIANSCALELFGYDNIAQLVGKNVLELIPPAYHDYTLEKVKELKQKKRLRNQIFICCKRDGSDFVGEVSCSGIYDQSGVLLYCVGVVRDVTTCKEAETELKKSEERFRMLLDYLPNVGIIGYGIDGTIHYWNKTSEKIYGYSSKDALNKNIFDLIVPLQQRDKMRTMLINGAQTAEMPQPAETSMLRSDGSEVVVFTIHALIKRTENDCEFFRFDIDLTERNMIQQELFKSQKLEALSQLAGGIAHDFNNILTGITTNLFVAKMQLDKQSNEFNLILEAEKSAFKASKLVNQLLAFSKSRVPVKETLSLKELIEDNIGFSISGSSIDYNLLIEPNLEPVLADRGQIDQVLSHLIINAKNAMTSGGTITIRAENIFVTPGLNLPLRPGEYVKVSIEDEGSVISNLDNIFDPYFSTKVQNNGLGLSVAYSIIKKHDGHLIAESKKTGKGCIFSFFLPASKLTNKENNTQGEKIVSGKGKVLVMDDQADIRTIVEKLLRYAGYDVVCVADGEEAVETFRTCFNDGNPFDVTILDLTVPGGMGALKAIEHIKKLDPEAKVIVSTGYSNDSILESFSDYGFCAVVKKPFTIEEFTAVLKHTIESK